jgi:hypothetical protein
MTQHDAEVLAQFASTWRMAKHNPSLLACLQLDLNKWCREHCMEFDHVAYWAMIDQVMKS